MFLPELLELLTLAKEATHESDSVWCWHDAFLRHRFLEDLTGKSTPQEHCKQEKHFSSDMIYSAMAVGSDLIVQRMMLPACMCPS